MDYAFKRNRRYFDDFPHLWAIIPYCDQHLNIEAHELNGDLVSASVKPGVRWWIALMREGDIEEVWEIPRVEGANLAAEIGLKLGTSIVFSRALYLVSVDPEDQFERKVVIHKPRMVRDLFSRHEIPILQVCMNRHHYKKAA